MNLLVLMFRVWVSHRNVPVNTLTVPTSISQRASSWLDSERISPTHQYNHIYVMLFTMIVCYRIVHDAE